MDDLSEQANLHSAGAIIRHTSPFSDLNSYKNDFQLTRDFLSIWVHPFYMDIGKYGYYEWIGPIKLLKSEISRDIALSLLGDFNWRTRLVGAYFSAIKNYTDHIDVIGTHLLKSELCCVGHIYALTLAYFNSLKSVQYLNTYLEYYLTQPHLGFDQSYVFSGLCYLDKINGTNHSARHLDNWKALLEIRKAPASSPPDIIYFEEHISILKDIIEFVG
jgi:uncharacterized protein DUF6000